MRRLTSGLPPMLLAALLLFARLVAPAMAMPTLADDPLSQLISQTICHTGGPGEKPAPAGHSKSGDCLACPACHLVAHAVLPMPSAPGVRLPALSPIGIATPRPPATGPPSQVRTAAQPTGPPRLSA